jgi:23S rRNA pseudouridine1911/1915/1917 synthase
MDVLYLDNHLFVVRKPAGMLVQGDHTGDDNLLDLGKAFLKVEFNKPGNVFLGLVHRLDRPVSGVVAFARTSTAARRLSDQFRERTVEKRYWALVQGKAPETGRLVNYLARRQSKSRVVDDKTRAQLAELSFELLVYADGVSWVSVDLATGRHHQIRVQFANIGHALLGDFKYGSRKPFPKRSLALHARSLTLLHPTKKERMTFETEPEAFWPEQFT